MRGPGRAPSGDPVWGLRSAAARPGAAEPGAPRREVRSSKPVTFWAPPPTLAAQAAAAGDGGAGAPGILRARVPRGRRRAAPPGVSAGGRGLRASGVAERSGDAATARALLSR